MSKRKKKQQKRRQNAARRSAPQAQKPVKRVPEAEETDPKAGKPAPETDEAAREPAEAAPEAAPETAETAPAADPAALEAARREKLHKRRMKALRSLLIRTAALALVLYVLFVHLVGVMVMPTGDMAPRMDAGDLVLFYRLERNWHAQDVIVFRKPTASLERSYAQNAAEASVRTEKSAIRRALDWLGFADPAEPPMTTFVCRIVAGPGDTVEITDSEHLVVNGNTVVEHNIYYSTPPYEGFVQYPLTLGEGQYFVLADSRNGGADSRFFGAVNADEILGTVITVMRRNNL